MTSSKEYMYPVSLIFESKVTHDENHLLGLEKLTSEGLAVARKDLRKLYRTVLRNDLLLLLWLLELSCCARNCRCEDPVPK